MTRAWAATLITAYLAPFAALLTLAVASQVPSVVSRYNLQKALFTRGISTEARVKSLYADDCSRSGCSMFSKISFVTKGEHATDVEGTSIIAGPHHDNDPLLSGVRSGRSIWVVFDPDMPNDFLTEGNSRIPIEAPM